MPSFTKRRDRVAVDNLFAFGTARAEKLNVVVLAIEAFVFLHKWALGKVLSALLAVETSRVELPLLCDQVSFLTVQR